jgi:hypothetical protein
MAKDDIKVDASEVVDEHTNETDCEAIKTLVDAHVDDRSNEIDHVTSKGGDLESLSVDGATNGSYNCLPATGSPHPMHQ